jgi:hypothetical protein
MFCQHCGAHAEQGNYCANCGSRLERRPDGDRHESSPAHTSRSFIRGVALAGVSAGVIIVLLVAILVTTMRNDTSEVAAGTRTEDLTNRAPATKNPQVGAPNSGPERRPARPDKRPKSSTERGPGDVRDLPAGLFCRDLDARGYSYSAAVDYWRVHGQPDQMDEDLNGIPCETVYPASSVTAYWGDELPAPQGIESLPGDLFCRDLNAQGFGYSEAVDYWFLHGAPDRMDEDLNGIPCETVYPPADVRAYW